LRQISTTTTSGLDEQSWKLQSPTALWQSNNMEVGNANQLEANISLNDYFMTSIDSSDTPLHCAQTTSKVVMIALY